MRLEGRTLFPNEPFRPVEDTRLTPSPADNFIMNVAIASVGLATAQGGASDIVEGAALRPPAGLPWAAAKRTTCQSSFQAAGVEPSLGGRDRWSALAVKALADCFGGNPPSAGTPLLVASCNGAAAGFDADVWRHAFDAQTLLKGAALTSKNRPVFSASCNSGLQALFIAKLLLLTGYSDDVIVLAADILAPASHDNFEVLRVLSDTPAPWQHASGGFILGEAAVALHLVRTRHAEGAPCLDGPVLGSDLEGFDGLSAVLSGLRLERLKLVLGQGTGPFQSDELELAALRAAAGETIPLATPLAHFGHTLGASSLLSVALAALAWKSTEPLPALSMPAPSAVDGRPLFDGSALGGDALVTCRALSGACAAVGVGSSAMLRTQQSRRWHLARGHGVLMHRTLRQIAAEAVSRRPRVAPDILVVRMDAPLLPDERASIGGRLLPSAVLELTPGFVPQLIARCWGFTGGALCLVGDADGDTDESEILEACKESGLIVSRILLRGGGDDRAVEWDD
ncbi:MAG TPA: hypothetical protein VF588_20445 [Pyrinomonadaceae bacterium]|jgi:hypothetical protein